jgi:hypothetical protein
MSDSARSSCGLSARTILIGCSLAHSRSGPAAVVVARGGMNASARIFRRSRTFVALEFRPEGLALPYGACDSPRVVRTFG